MSEKYVALNGRILPEYRASISVADRGLQYGDGFFETMLAVKGEAEFLNEHLLRLDRACAKFKIGFRSNSEKWPKLISALLEVNRLFDVPAAVKIVVTRGVTEEAGLKLNADTLPTVIVTARAYIHPSRTLQGRGFRLKIFPLTRSAPLAHYKSLNYLFYLAARDFAACRDAHEAILLDPEGHVLECSTSNIFYRSGNTVCKPPAAAPYLQGIMEGKVLEYLSGAGFAIREVLFRPEELMEAAEVFLTNSLIRIMPVCEIEGKSCACEPIIVPLIREHFGVLENISGH